MALLRHPGFGLRHDEAPPRELVAYLGSIPAKVRIAT
jgi:hypothetical protein